MHKALVRWRKSDSFTVGAGFVLTSAAVACSRGGISAGGGGAGRPRMLSKTYRPRLTGDVRSGFEVVTSMVPWVKMPPRWLSGGNDTFLIWSPVTLSMP